MDIRGIFVKFISRNEKTGESSFYVRSENKPVLCAGVIQNYPKDTPLLLSGDKKDKFYVQSCHMDAFDKRAMHTFMSSGNFNGVGPAVANIAMNSIGQDLFTALRKNTVDDLISDISTGKESIYRMLLCLKGYIDFEDIYDYLRSLGCDYDTSWHLFEKFGASASGMVKNNPYILTYAGLSFDKCELIAKENGANMCDKKRLSALVESVMLLNKTSGNTKIEYGDLLALIKKTEEKAGCFTTPQLFICEALADKKYSLEEAGDELFIYFKEDYDNETEIARHIKRICSTKTPLSSLIPIEDIENLLGITYAKGQKSAFDSIKESGIKIITGGPGTGKTTILNGILKKYEMENKNKEIALCAPTSFAAKKMREYTGRDASTIHKMLGYCPFSGEEKRVYNDSLSADLIVVDESSMVDNELMALLLKSVKNGALVLFIGDRDQLPPVGCGNAFADMIGSGKVDIYTLDHIFRQAGKSVIIDNSRKVINGEKDLETAKNFVIKRFDSEKDMIENAVSVYDKCEKKGITDIKLFTPSRNKKFASGSISMNSALKKHSRTEDELSFGYYSFCTGDKVIFSRNNYDRGYYNGQEGVITSIQKIYNEIHVKVETDEGAIFLEKSELKDLELAYAITAHKAQGSECRNAVILVPKKPASMLKRQLLYVEITRAKENVMILSEGDALEQAISSKYEFERNTGLIDKLRSA